MVHKLEVWITYSIGVNRYEGLLSEWEFPRGSDIDISVGVTNLGNNPFSGKFNRLQVAFGTTSFGSSSIIEFQPETQVKNLLPNQSISLHQTSIAAYSEGQGWLHCRFESIDNEPIEYFQTPEGPSTGIEQSDHGFQVISREQLEIILLLKEIVSRLPSV